MRYNPRQQIAKMAYEALTRVLEKGGEATTLVQRCILIKVGAVAFEDEHGSQDPAARSEFAKKLVDQLVKAVACHPNVAEPVHIGQAVHATTTLGGSEVLTTGEHFLFHVTLPRPRLKYAPWSSCKDIEDFYAITSGSLFATFKEVADLDEPCGIGQEFRELLDAQIRGASQLKSSHVAPTPLHPDMYLVLSDADASQPGRPKIVMRREDLILILGDAKPKTADLADSFFRSIETTILSFYRNSLARSASDDITSKVLARFSRLSRCAQAAFATPPWKLLRSRRLSQEAQTHLSSIHESIVEREAMEIGFNSSRESFLRSVAEHPILGQLRDYFSRELRKEEEIPKSLIAALTYFQSQLSLALNIRTLLIATILGAVVGAVLGTALTSVAARYSH
jgi:hypothetical protein